MLRCKDNSIYTGITTDVERRMKEHFSKEEKEKLIKDNSLFNELLSEKIKVDKYKKIK
jgi:predicted GIY-YIG superfamily endonuclease